MNLELQQRAVEYNSIIKRYTNLKDGLFEQMPPLEMKQTTYVNGVDEEAYLNEQIDDETVKQQQKEAAAKSLLDLFDDEPSTANSATHDTQPTTANKTNNNFEILDFMSNETPSNTNTLDLIKQISNHTATSNTSNNLGSLFSTSTAKTNDLDFLDVFAGGSSNTAKAAPVQTKSSDNSAALNDLLGFSNATPVANNQSGAKSNDILDFFSMPSTPAAQTPSKPQQSLMGNDIFGGLGTTVPAMPSKTSNSNGIDIFSSLSGPSNSRTLVIYEKNDIKITFEPSAGGNHSNFEQHFIQMNAQNMSIMNTVKEFLFSCAVPKTMQMQLSQPSTNVIQPLSSMNQTIAISNPNKVWL